MRENSKKVLLSALNAMGEHISNSELDESVEVLAEYEIVPDYRVLESNHQGMVNLDYKDGKQRRRERRKVERMKINY